MNITRRNNIRKFGNSSQTMIFAHGFGCGQNVWRHLVKALQPLLKMNSKINEVSLTIQSRIGNLPCLFTALVKEVEIGKEPIIVGTLFRISDRKKYESELLKAKVKSQEQENIKTQSLAEVAHIQAH